MSDGREQQGGPPQGEQQGGGQGERARRAGTSRWEWVVGILGALVVAGVIGYLWYQEETRADFPTAEIVVLPDSIVPYAGGHLVYFVARNDGGQTAASLLVEGTLTADTGQVETSQTTLSYVPSHSKRFGGLFFTHDPSRYRLELRPLGYDVP